MTDLTVLTYPNRASIDMEYQGTVVTSEVTGKVFETKYSRDLWSGIYTWTNAAPEAMRRIVSALRDANNRYKVRLPFPVGVNRYEGTLSDWTDNENGTFTFNGVELFVGEYVQLGNYCSEIVEKTTEESNTLYRFNNHPIVIPQEMETATILYDHAPRDAFVVDDMDRDIEYPHYHNSHSGVICRNFDFFCIAQNTEPRRRTFGVRNSIHKQEQIQLRWREVV